MPGSLISGSLWSQWRGKRSRHSRRMHNMQFYNFTYLVLPVYCVLPHRVLHILVCFIGMVFFSSRFSCYQFIRYCWGRKIYFCFKHRPRVFHVTGLLEWRVMSRLIRRGKVRMGRASNFISYLFGIICMHHDAHILLLPLTLILYPSSWYIPMEILCRCYMMNTLRPGDVYLWKVSSSVQIMVCCFTKASHYPYQW